MGDGSMSCPCSILVSYRLVITWGSCPACTTGCSTRPELWLMVCILHKDREIQMCGLSSVCDDACVQFLRFHEDVSQLLLQESEREEVKPYYSSPTHLVTQSGLHACFNLIPNNGSWRLVTYDRCKQLWSRASRCHESCTSHIFTEMQALQRKRAKSVVRLPAQ